MHHRDQRAKLSLDHSVPKMLRQHLRTSHVHPEIYCSATALAGAPHHVRRSKGGGDRVATEIVDDSRTR